MSTGSETDFVDHKHATDSYEDQIEETLDENNLNPADLGHAKFFQNLSTSTCNTGIKNDDIDIFYEDIKRETGEEKSRERIGFCDMCYQSFSDETDIFKSTSYRSECSCQKQNEPFFYNIRGQDMTFDAKPTLLDFNTESKLQPLEVQDETISEYEVTKEQDPPAVPRRLSVPPVENRNEKTLKICLERLEINPSPTERKNQYRSCSKSISQNKTLKVDGDRTGKKRFPCKICAKTFTTWSLMRAHGKIHTKEKRFYCKVCSKAFKKSYHLRVHERIHTKEKPFQCKICLTAFAHSTTLKVHERVHTQEKPFNCKMCLKSFSRMDSLKVHERGHSDENRVSCNICFKTYASLSHMKAHLRIHTGEKSFQCKICSKSFNENSTLKAHERVHTGERPFCCKICSKSFTQKGAMKIHERGHTGDDPFRCKICSKTFTTSSLLRVHGRIHA